MIKFATIIAITFLAGVAFGSDQILLNNNIYSDITDRGLEIHVLKFDAASKVVAKVYIKGGVFAENDKRGSGLANAVQQMIYQALLEQQKSLSNGLALSQLSISLDYNSMCFTLETIPEELKLAIAQMAKVIISQRFHLKDWRIVREQIMSEINSQEDRPQVKLDQMFKESAYPTGSINNPLMGCYDLFMQLDRKDLLKYYDDIFVAANFMVLVAGDVMPKQLCWHIGYAFKDLPIAAEYMDMAYAQNLQNSPRWVERFGAVTQSWVSIGVALPAQEHDFMNRLTTRLLQGKIPKIKAFLNEVSNYNGEPQIDLFKPPGFHQMVRLSFKIKNSNALKASRKLALWLCDDFIEEWSAPEIKAQCQLMVTQHLISQNDINKVAETIGDSLIRNGSPLYESFQANQLLKFDMDQYLAFIKTYFNQARLTTVTLSPKVVFSENLLMGMEQLLLEDSASNLELVYLENGVKLILDSKPEAKLVKIQFSCGGGIWYENRLNNGTFGMLASILAQEIEPKPPLRYAFEKIGMQLESQVGVQQLCLNATVRPKFITQALQQLCASWSSPKFTKENLEFVRISKLQQINFQSTNATAMADLLIRSSVFEKEPFNKNILGNLVTLGRIDLRDIQLAYKDFVTPANSIIVVSGNFSSDEVARDIKKYFKRYKSAPKSRSFKLQQPHLVLTNSPPYIVLDYHKKLPPTNKIIRVFNWDNNYSMVVCGAQLPGINSTNYPLGLAEIIKGGLDFELDKIGAGWQDDQGRKIIENAEIKSYQGYNIGWIYIYITVPNQMSKQAALKLFDLFENALAGLQDGSIYGKAQARAIFNNKMADKPDFEKLDKISRNILFGLSLKEDDFVKKINDYPPEKIAQYIEEMAAFPVTVVVVPEK